jgi:hypothetical protein
MKIWWVAGRVVPCKRTDRLTEGNDEADGRFFSIFRTRLKQFSKMWSCKYWPGNSVGIAIGYEMDARRSNPGGCEIFRTCPDRSWGPPSLLYNWYRVFPGGRKRPGRDAEPSPLLVPRSWNRVDLYLDSPKGPSWPVKRVKPTIS